mmetsp:Transcript_42424/g.50902  ORF Transcript_42424/g.50902 Transcript_42424/m.50902 type:complete len:147 (+) Transcript_42424:465-905(+)
MKSEEKLQDQLESEKKIVSEMALSIKDMELSFKEATTPMAKVVEEKDDETCRLKFENTVMIGKIATLQEERNELKWQLSSILNRRERLEQMMDIADDIRSPSCKSEMEIISHSNEGESCQNDFLVHTTHNKQRSSKPWHVSVINTA